MAAAAATVRDNTSVVVTSVDAADRLMAAAARLTRT